MSPHAPHWPSFLGIGVPKAGTTWLYELLKSHPQIWVPPDRREIHFFNREFHRGLDWYEQFFPTDSHSSYESIGEVSTHYFYCGPERIGALKSALPSVERLILLLRDPVDRLQSHYWFRRRLEGFDYSFREFIQRHPNVVDWGRYAKYLERWLNYFDQEQILILTTELDLRRAEESREQIAHFLGVDPDLFPEDAGQTKQNSRHLPYFQTAYAWASWMHRTLIQADIQWPSKIAHRLGVRKWFGKQEVDESLDPALREDLSAMYVEEVKRLEGMLGTSFPEWNTSPASNTSTGVEDSEIQRD